MRESGLAEDGPETGEHLVCGVGGRGLEESAVAGPQVEDAGLVTADNSTRSRLRIVERYGESTPSCKVTAGGDGYHDGGPGQVIEGDGRNDHDRSGSALFVTCCQVEIYEPDVPASGQSISAPRAAPSIQARSSSSGGGVGSHCAIRSSSE